MSKFAPERLKEIIVVRNIKLDELAECVGITKQAISKYTNGKSIPSEDIFSKLVKELEIPSSYLFCEKPLYIDPTSPLFFRANSSTTKSAKELARTICGWGYEIAMNIGENKIDSLPNLSEGMDVYHKANQLRALWGLENKPIDNVVALLEQHGFFVFTFKSSELNTDAYSQIIGGVPIIILNTHKGTAVRQRFSLAHELGHLILHNNISSTEFELNNKAFEAEASAFANEFLLPSKNYKEFVNTKNIEILIQLKQKWKISLAAMLFHCKQRGLFDEIDAKRLQVQLSKKWGRMAEPFDDEILNEVPTKLANKIIDMMKEQYDFAELASNLLLPLDDVGYLLSLPIEYFEQFSMLCSLKTNSPNTFEQLSLFGSEVIANA